DAEDVAGDPVLDGQAVLGNGQRGIAHVLGELPAPGATGRAWIGQVVVVAGVAVDRGADRVELEETLPEAVGEPVDGGWLRHEVASEDGAREAGAARLPPSAARPARAAGRCPRRQRPGREA